MRRPKVFSLLIFFSPSFSNHISRFPFFSSAFAPFVYRQLRQQHHSSSTTTTFGMSSTTSKSTTTNAAAAAAATIISTTTTVTKPRILCLHGKYQSGAIFSNKIAGARRKLERRYDLDFLDGPLRLPSLMNGNDTTTTTTTTNNNINTRITTTTTMQEAADEPAYFAWWQKDEETGQHILVQEGMEYVLQYLEKQQQQRPYDAVIGFSQGGVVATALCCSGRVPSLKAVVTAGSPMVEEAFVVADALARKTGSTQQQQQQQQQQGSNVPKLHMAGESDAMIPVSSTQALCDRGGNGRLIRHDQGHLFPTRSIRVQAVLDFLEDALSSCPNKVENTTDIEK